jgi:peptidyl-prolyl cis-trans isomerase B (cyclophilin B)
MNLMKRSLVFIVPTLLLFGAAANAQQASPTPATEKNEPMKTNTRPAPGPRKRMVQSLFDQADVKTMASKCVTLDTEAGAIELEMFPEQAPETVRNFLILASIGAFDTTTFSRIVPGFVIQGGDLYTREKISEILAMHARFTISDEPNKILHERGIVSMARADEPNTATTNFFILVTSAPYLDGKFAAFGRVTKGIDVVEAINKMPVDGETPQKPVRIKKASVAQCAGGQTDASPL